MRVPDPDQKLSKENIELWLKDFLPKLKRTTTRTPKCRLISSVERKDFDMVEYAQYWTEVKFQGGKCSVFAKHLLEDISEYTALQANILKSNPKLCGKTIKRCEMRAERGKWLPDSLQTVISEGGEALVLAQTIADIEVAVRVQAFDPFLFTDKEKLTNICFEIYVSSDYQVATNMENDENVIPFHKNIIRNFANIEAYLETDKKKANCLGWITLMEKCNGCLRSELKKDSLSLQRRQEISRGIKDGIKYLLEIGIEHNDLKPGNILLLDGVPKIIDYGLVEDGSGRTSYQQMGYVRNGSKYKDFYNLFSGSAAFSSSQQLTSQWGKVDERKLYVFLFCDWKTAWSLYYNPMKKEDRKFIDSVLRDCNAEWLNYYEEPSYDEINNTSKVVSLKDARADLCLDDPNLTKSLAMACLKQKLTRSRNTVFFNISKNVLNQDISNLCVPISVTTLIRFALIQDLKFVDKKEEYSFERIFNTLTMVVYPRSLAGLNLNPKEEETDFQKNDIECLLARLSRKTYLSDSGWDIIRNINTYNAIHRIQRPMKFISSGSRSPTWNRPTSGFSKGSNKPVDSNCLIEKVLLNENFIFKRPLTVTGAYLQQGGEVFFHQMVLDRIENNEYIIQNTQLNTGGAVLRIPLTDPYYVTYELACSQFNQHGRYAYSTIGEFMKLVNERIQNMEVQKWYLLPQAYSLTLVQTFQ